tara:strand:+ start:241 stop:456 length:216 start_codon:yes stop_codon:yes gene_type:complete
MAFEFDTLTNGSVVNGALSSTGGKLVPVLITLRKATHSFLNPRSWRLPGFIDPTASIVSEPPGKTLTEGGR